jgi:hypothetical protein
LKRFILLKALSKDWESSHFLCVFNNIQLFAGVPLFRPTVQVEAVILLFAKMQAFLDLRAEVSTFFDFQQVFPFLA